MRKPLVILLCVFGFLEAKTKVRIKPAYTVFSLLDTPACSGSHFEISMLPRTSNSSGILKESHSGASYPGKHCVVTIRPPANHGVVVSIRSIDLEPFSSNYSECENYLQIQPTEDGTVKLCGYSMDILEYKSFNCWGDTTITFHTSNTTHENTKTTFQLTFTAFRKGGISMRGEMPCYNDHHIWQGLACDGHNNCGDLSDEVSKEISQCGVTPLGLSLGVILASIIGSLILLVLLFYLKGNKVTEQIERLSREENVRRQENQERNPSDSLQVSVQAVVSERDSVPVLHHGSRRDLSPDLISNSNDMSDTIDEPPPSYDEVQRLSVAPISYLTFTEQPSPNRNNISS